MRERGAPTTQPTPGGACPRCGGQTYAGLTHLCTTTVRFDRHSSLCAIHVSGHNQPCSCEEVDATA